MQTNSWMKEVILWDFSKAILENCGEPQHEVEVGEPDWRDLVHQKNLIITKPLLVNTEHDDRLMTNNSLFF